MAFWVEEVIEEIKCPCSSRGIGWVEYQLYAMTKWHETLHINSIQYTIAKFDIHQRSPLGLRLKHSRF